ncbi:MAG: DNA polymerase III subunit delta [Chloroflexi bacterium]|nr:DNA polymerase III subunit delta [Chloroflexota bacterium]
MGQTSEKPRVYLFYGDDSQARARALEKLRRGLGADHHAALDYIRIEGEKASLPQLHDAVLTIPFFSTRRLVHVLSPLAMPKLKSQADRAAFLELLGKVPPSTALVLDEPQNLAENHWLLRWAKKHAPLAFVRGYTLPKDLTRWILAQAKEEGGQFTPRAAAELARRVDGDAQWARNEIHKLLAYVGYTRPVDVEDVQELTPAMEHPNIFAMVDAMALGQTERAMRLLYQLRQQEETPRIWGMVVRQFRLLILTREALDLGFTDKNSIAKALSIKPFVAQKLLPQARRFPASRLTQIYRRLRDTDRAWKTGEMDLDTALDLLLASLRRAG